MYLKELSINGFKSFAKKSELEFSTPITAIVGPNGSGKSNVAESFRFVLGEQSPSKMRGKKGEDLIFNGSESTARANRASVSITLNNEKKIFPLDFEEIIIERVVHRDGTNEYFINGSRTRLKDVQELLAAANIGSTGHHIISQGEADRILSANPKERREMIEDALGLKVYQYKKQESERKLKKTVENIAHVESLRREVQPHLRFLERQVKKIERSLELREELKGVYAEYLKREDTYIAFHYDRLMEAKREPEAALAMLAKELEDAKTKLAASSKDEKSSALVAIEEEVSQVRKERQDIVRESGQIEGQIAFLTRRIDERKRKAHEEAELPIPSHEVKKLALHAENALAKGDIETNTSFLLSTLRELLASLRLLLRKADEGEHPETKREEAELVELTREKKQCDEKLADISEREQKAEKEYDAIRASIEAEHSASREAEREVFRIMNAQREEEAVRTRLLSELRDIERDRNEFKRELQEAVVLIGSAASAYFTLEIHDGERVVTAEEIVKEQREVQRERRHALEKMKIRLEELGDGATEDVLKEYKDVKERDEFLVREIEDLTLSVEKLNTLIAELASELNTQFVEGIDKIAEEFDKFFVLMFGGGEAKLIRVAPKTKKAAEEDTEVGALEEEEEKEIEEGIEIDIKLPNKRVRGLDMLSGGERALTSIALIFAMSQVNPPLFVILDETDAALDEANSRRYGDMISALAKRSQLILITHNRETMSRAGVLYGVTMGGDGMSKLLSVKFEEAVAVAK